MVPKILKSNEQWRAELPRARYLVLREAATEPPYSGELFDDFEPGRFCCAACGAEIFDAKDKFASHCGWPAFSDVISPQVIEQKTDNSHGMLRTEVLCAACDSHLGHVFCDGPEPTGVRYCINSLALKRAKNGVSKSV